jgi:protoporphyrinogen oxidase
MPCPAVAAPPTTRLQRYNQQVVGIDKDTKTVTLADGGKIIYDKLISTIPLDITLKWLGKPEWTARLQHSSSHIIGIGIRGEWWVAGRGKRGVT